MSYASNWGGPDEVSISYVLSLSSLSIQIHAPGTWNTPNSPVVSSFYLTEHASASSSLLNPCGVSPALISTALMGVDLIALIHKCNVLHCNLSTLCNYVLEAALYTIQP